MELMQTILAFVVALGILVTVHEYGHYWVARRVGVKILRFSIGFGRGLWSTNKGEDETEFVIAAIPLGGYVKMLDEREGEVPSELRHRAFNNQTLAARTAIVLAGPLANFLFAFVVYWAMYIVGVSGPRPVVGEIIPHSLASMAGLKTGEEIKGVNGQDSPTWDNVFRSATTAILDSTSIVLQVVNEGGYERDVFISLGNISVDDLSRGEFFDKVGFKPYRVPIEPLIGGVIAGDPAALAGIRSGDRVISADGNNIATWLEWVEYVRARPEEAIDLVLLRDGERLTLSLTPKRVERSGKVVGRIGAEVDVSTVVTLPLGTERYGIWQAIPRAIERTGEVVAITCKFLRKMILGEASMQNLSGPISIASYARESAEMGFSRFLDFLGLVSISLGVLNLLPIPLLDGGHLLYYLIEFATRRPVPETVQLIGHQIGLALLLGLMSVAVYNDIMRMM
ncbi:MAG TPA: RIP metalloprotease RseP [Gammaproteobacteria bacterium]|nr:RIP metalloprotease RseP [Gammaproteobacteria bacterium]|tara:strand:+ start:1088 stop:2446 length:1359 start_codon:yes stop_codon:yes gene_type:complete